MHEDLVTVGTKELVRNFDHRIVGIGFVAVVYCCKCHQLPPAITLRSWQRIGSSLLDD
jgi:hypothetical protein